MVPRNVRTVLIFVLSLFVPAATVGHVEEGRAVPVRSFGAHNHGPSVPCPPVETPRCLACAAASLFAAPPSVSRIVAPAIASIQRDASSRLESRATSTLEIGRSPPLSS